VIRLTTPKLSNSPVSQAIYSDIWGYLEELGIDEVKHYMGAFPRETDFNLVQYGEMRIYYAEIREMYVNAGAKQYGETYKRARNGNAAGDYKISDDQLWEFYKRDVARIAREFTHR